MEKKEGRKEGIRREGWNQRNERRIKNKIEERKEWQDKKDSNDNTDRDTAFSKVKTMNKKEGKREKKL